MLTALYRLWIVCLLWSCACTQKLPDFLVSTSDGVALVRLSDSNNRTIPLHGTSSRIQTLDYIYADGTLFLCDLSGSDAVVSRYNAKTSQKTLLLPDARVTPGRGSVAADWVNEKLYFISEDGLSDPPVAGSYRIEVVNSDGSMRAVVVWERLAQPKSLVLDPLHGKMYWINGDSLSHMQASIDATGMDGAGRVVVVKDGLVSPDSLALDLGASGPRLFWADINSHGMEGWIDSLHLVSGRRTRIVERIEAGTELNYFEDFLYWTRYDNLDIIRMPARPNSTPVTAFSRDSTVDRPLYPILHVYAKDKQPARVSENPCSRKNNNGGCSHLCLLSDMSPYMSCACPTGVALLADNKTCASGINVSLLIVASNGRKIYRISLDTHDFTPIQVDVGRIDSCRALAHDPAQGRIYWADMGERRVIRRAFLDGTGVEDVIVSDLQSVEGLAVDWIAGQLYFTDLESRRIDVALCDGSSRRTLIGSGLKRPGSIAVDPVGGYLFWVDLDLYVIERTFLDGSNRTVLQKLRNDSTVNALVFDWRTDRLYWTESVYDTIGWTNTRTGLTSTFVYADVPYAYGLGVLEGHVFWTDWQRRCIERVRKSDGGQRGLVAEIPGATIMLAVNATAVPQGTNACARQSSVCSHLCFYVPQPLGPGPVCKCPVGMDLLHDKRSCEQPQLFLLATTRKNELRRMSLPSGSSETIYRSPSQSQPSMVLDVIVSRDQVYWTADDRIFRAYFNGSHVETLMHGGLGVLEGICCDWISGNIYWASRNNHEIGVARSFGKLVRRIILDGVNPYRIAVDPIDGFIYWAEVPPHGPGTIERAELDGAGRMSLVFDVVAYDIALDTTARRIYFTDISYAAPVGAIMSVDYRGGDRRVIVGNQPSRKAITLTLLNDFVYFITNPDNSPDSSALGALAYCDKNGTQTPTMVPTMDVALFDIQAVHANKQSGRNPCAINNGECADLCFAKPSGTQSPGRWLRVECGCPTHYTSTGNQQCVPPKDFLLFTVYKGQGTSSIMRARFGVKDVAEEPIMPLPFSHVVKGPVHKMQYDRKERMLYWQGIKRRVLFRAREDGTEVEEVALGKAHSIHDFALDAHADLLFFSSDTSKSINVTRLSHLTTVKNGPQLKSIGAVVSGAQYEPLALDVHWLHGHIFFVNRLKKAPNSDARTMSSQIVRCHLSGAQCQPLELKNISNPTVLLVDNTAELLFWADAERKSISQGSVDGLQQKILVEALPHEVQSLAVYNHRLYWISKNSQVIESVGKFEGEDRRPELRRYSQMGSLFAVEEHVTEQLRSSPCSTSVVANAGQRPCSHICQPPSEPEASIACVCPLNMTVGDGGDCVDMAHCSSGQFLCDSGTQCLDNVFQHCDGIGQCADSSDERGCHVCGPNMWSCRHKSPYQCIMKTNVCDGNNDCSDGSDEETCRCTPAHEQFFCLHSDDYRTGVCIARDQLCTGMHQCVNEGLLCKKVPEETTTDSGSTGTGAGTSVTVIASVLGTLLLVGVACALCCYRYRRSTPAAVTGGGGPSRRLLAPSSEQSTVCVRALHDGTVSVSIANSYDRGRLTGRSSSSAATGSIASSTTAASRCEAAPPPSPVSSASGEHVTTMNMRVSIHGRQVSRHRKSARHAGRRCTPPPPYTPCSTDVNVNTESEAMCPFRAPPNSPKQRRRRRALQSQPKEGRAPAAITPAYVDDLLAPYPSPRSSAGSQESCV